MWWLGTAASCRVAAIQSFDYFPHPALRYGSTVVLVDIDVAVIVINGVKKQGWKGSTIVKDDHHLDG